MTDLKPCPFCNGKPILDQDNEAIFDIYCSGCRAEIRGSLDKEAIIRNWNMRVNDEDGMD